MSLQDQVDAIVAKSVMVVCDGWTLPRHERVVIQLGNPLVISHGMCSECKAVWERTAWSEPEMEES